MPGDYTPSAETEGFLEVTIEPSNAGAAQAARRGLRAVRFKRVATVGFALLTFGCALSDDYGSTTYSVPRAARLFSAGYEGVNEIYIQERSIFHLARAGFDGLASIDPAIQVGYGPDQVDLSIGGHSLTSFPRPEDDDADAWGELTANAIEAIQPRSRAIATAEPEQLYEAVFDSMIGELDGYSRYASRERARENRAGRDGFGGLGITIGIVPEGVKVKAVMEDTPAARAGLRVDDIITAIDDESAAGIKQRDAIRRLRGAVRSRVRLTVARPPVEAPLLITVARGHIVPQTVTFREEEDAAYLRVTSFNQRTSQSLRDKILLAERQMGRRLKGFVLDLRGNPGGLLDQAVSVSDLFVTSGSIVSTHGRHPDSHQFFDARKDDLAQGLPVIVLINGHSASASEIVAAALQDRGRALVIGSASYGKGTVQNVKSLPNEGEMALTWARFHAPSGYALEQRGVIPNICTSGVDQDAGQMLNQIRHGEAVIATATTRRKLDPDDKAQIEALRALCPVVEEDRDLDLQVALAVLSDSPLYAQILGRSAETAERPTIQ